MPDTIAIYLIRHAIAAQRGPAYGTDGRRPLTARGIARFRKAVGALEALDVTIDQIFTSPFVRARQTAELVATGLRAHPPVIDLRALMPDGSPPAVLEQLAAEVRKSRIALVGHEPLLGELAARLIGARVPLELKKGAVCRIDVEGPPFTRPGRLRWFATPRMLRKIGG